MSLYVHRGGVDFLNTTAKISQITYNIKSMIVHRRRIFKVTISFEL